MIWVTWRQFRTTILFGVLTPLLLAAITIAITTIAGGVASTPVLQGCRSFEMPNCVAETTQAVAILLTIGLPVLFGAFVGATVFSRDLERRTHVVGLTQSVSRRRWYGVRVFVVFVPTILAMTLLGCALFWAKYRTAPNEFAFVMGGPGQTRMDFPIFGATGFVTGGYTAMALMLGAASALALRNTVAAMITTVIATSLVLALFPTEIREHYATPSVDVLELEQKVNELYGTFPAQYGQYGLFETYPRWDIESSYVDDAGNPVAPDYESCTTVDYNEMESRDNETVGDYRARYDRLMAEDGRLRLECLRAQGIDHFETKYHEDRLFWRFQTIETALSLLIAGLFGGMSLLLVRRLRP
ncbi:putative ABC transporter integral membrane subunit [Rhodococcus sp. AW25M09]|uniref:ABC transporter integral membrane subunit n=1 Tax=Rhodococcus sp. AW25M09 TaxID=1268303 RepID=UPI0002ACF126|nr:ABC transporter integral membrane subunit [Rhodococcus sp. AW25M09]CCQ16213.1 putative ABC transporter integral membrane subunit [Rhodococcus sp. AW25M09]